MLPHLPVLSILLAMAMITGATASRARPVQSDPLEPASDSSEALSAPAAPPTLASPILLDRSAVPPTTIPTAPSGSADGEAEGSALAAEIMVEAEVGAMGTGPRARTQSPMSITGAAATAQAAGATAGVAGVAARPAELDLPDEVRAYGKAAWSWAKSKLPWADDEIDRLDSEPTSPPTEINWSDGPSTADGTHRAAILQDAAEARTSGAGGSANGDSALPHTGDRNLVRDAMHMARRVVEHPMAWFIVLVFVIGGIAVSLADRRPKHGSGTLPAARGDARPMPAWTWSLGKRRTRR